MPYVDGFVIAIPARNLAAYRRMSARACTVWRDHGALDYVECVGDDLAIKHVLPFARLAKLKRGETVIFSWILYRSRKHRDTVNARVMKDPRRNSPRSTSAAGWPRGTFHHCLTRVRQERRLAPRGPVRARRQEAQVH